MSAEFTRSRRREIAEAFAIENNGVFSPSRFLDVVEAEGEGHPAYGWFQWDDEAAARQHRLWQAREFVRGISISVEVEQIGRREPFSVRAVDVPFAVSPMQGRADGGGYFLTRADDPEHLAELARQAAQSLRTWLHRYEGTLGILRINAGPMKKLLASLDHAGGDEDEAA